MEDLRLIELQADLEDMQRREPSIENAERVSELLTEITQILDGRGEDTSELKEALSHYDRLKEFMDSSTTEERKAELFAELSHYTHKKSLEGGDLESSAGPYFKNCTFILTLDLISPKGEKGRATNTIFIGEEGSNEPSLFSRWITQITKTAEKEGYRPAIIYSAIVDAHNHYNPAGNK